MARECCECGAKLPKGRSCQDLFHELLVFEGQVPGAPGSIVHFYTVSCYNLQHPDSTRLTQAALSGLAEALADALDGRADLEALRGRARSGAAAAGRVTVRPGDPPVVWRRGGWRLSLAHVLAGTLEEYVDRVMEWARSIREDLAAA